MPTLDQEMQLGLSDLARRLNKFGVQIIDQKRLWPERRVTYFVVGKAERHTDIVLSDEFVTDLPNTTSHQTAADSYAAGVAGRVRCGSPELFHCLSGTAVRIAINWDWGETALVGGVLKSWLSVTVTHQEHDTVAACAVTTQGTRFESPFERVRSIVNRIRYAIDKNAIPFYKRESRPATYQQIEGNLDEPTSHSQAEIAQFLVGKTYFLGFKVVDVLGEVWIADPWDANYLGVSSKDLSQAAYVLRARSLIQLDTTLNFARPADKLITTGWPAALDLIGVAEQPQKPSLSSLPNKDGLIADIRASLNRPAGLALLVIDLDHFKSVNDTKGHPEGDACLERVVQVIGGTLGRRGTLYRWGGDEFAVSLPDFSSEEARAVAERIRRAVEEAKPGGDIAVTTSIGVSGSDRFTAPSADELLDSADKAMYESKRRGKNRVTSWPIERAATR